MFRVIVYILEGKSGQPCELLPAQVVDAGVAAAKRLGLKWHKMVSRAYHDSLFMAKVLFLVKKTHLVWG